MNIELFSVIIGKVYIQFFCNGRGQAWYDWERGLMDVRDVSGRYWRGLGYGECFGIY